MCKGINIYIYMYGVSTYKYTSLYCYIYISYNIFVDGKGREIVCTFVEACCLAAHRQKILLLFFIFFFCILPSTYNSKHSHISISLLLRYPLVILFCYLFCIEK